MLKCIMIIIFVVAYILEVGLITPITIEIAKDVTNKISSREEHILDYLWFVTLYLIACFAISSTILLGYLSLKAYCILCAITFAYFNIVYLFNIDWKTIFKK